MPVDAGYCRHIGLVRDKRYPGGGRSLAVDIGIADEERLMGSNPVMLKNPQKRLGVGLRVCYFGSSHDTAEEPGKIE